jgi:hypothetical protein
MMVDQKVRDPGPFDPLSSPGRPGGAGVASTGRCRSDAGGSVDALAEQVGVAVVPGVFLDHVQVRKIVSSECPATASRAFATSSS